MKAGVPLSLSEKRAKAARKSGEARRNREPSDLYNPEALPASSLANVDEMMESYVEMVGPPVNWIDVKTYEQVKTEIYKNLDAARDSAVRARRLFTSDQVRARDERWNSIAHDRLDLVERLLDDLPDVPQDLRKSFLATARSWRVQTMQMLSGANAAPPPPAPPAAQETAPEAENGQ
jgi:hypothetical protein